MELEEYLEELNMPTTEFANIAGCSPPYMYLLVSKKRGCSRALAIQISAATGGKVSVEEIPAAKKPSRRKKRTVKKEEGAAG